MSAFPAGMSPSNERVMDAGGDRIEEFLCVNRAISHSSESAISNTFQVNANKFVETDRDEISGEAT